MIYGGIELKILETFLFQGGYNCRFSCAYTPQNGVIEEGIDMLLK